MLLDVPEWLRGFIQLFVIINSIGNMPVFYSLTEQMPSSVRRRVITRSIVIAAVILLVFGISGVYILWFFGITIHDFQIVGGIVILMIALAEMRGEPAPTRRIEPEELAVSPLATPLLAGPGAITTVMILSGLLPIYQLVLVILANGIVAYLVLVIGQYLFKYMGPTARRTLLRIMALFIAAIAISFLREGVTGFIREIAGSSG